MSWSINLVTPPAVEALDLNSIKGYSRVSIEAEDGLMTAFAAAVRNKTEEHLSRALITQTWELGLSCFPCGDRIYLPRGPVQSVVSVKYTDSAEVERTLTEGTDYLVDLTAQPAEIVLPFSKNWPTATLSPKRPIVIQTTNGYGDAASDIPPLILVAMQQLANHWFDYRGIIAEGGMPGTLPHVFESLLATFKYHYAGPF